MRYECEVVVLSKYVLAIEADSCDEARVRAIDQAGEGDPEHSTIEVRVDRGVR